VESLGRRIVRGEYPVGAPLPVEGELAIGSEASRTVVREALRVLAAKGLVEARPMRGTRVRPRREWRLLDPDVLRWWVEEEGEATILHDLLEVRAIVEPAAARIAAERADEPARAELRDAWASLCAAVDDPGRFIEADLRYHAAILAATRNALLEELLEAISATLRLGLLVQVRVAADHLPRLRDSLPLHEETVLAITAGDGDRAEATMRLLVAGAARDAEHALGMRPAGGVGG
jgi:DNA-binding FadR family transcriptional regulator